MDTYLFFRKYKSVAVFFVQSLPGLTLSPKGFVVCTSLTTCALALHTSTPLIDKYKHRHATPQVFKTNAEFSPRLRDILQVFQTCCRRVF